MTLWLRYNFIFFAGPLLSFFIFFIISALFSKVILGLIVMGCGMLLCIILLLSIVCPNCKTSLYNSNSIFSSHYKGFQILIPKKCVNCDYDLDRVLKNS